ncbi:MAG: asparaginase [Bacteroidia bacterium]
MAKRSSILLIYTGGTIGMINDPKTGQLKPFNFGRMLDEVPELRKFDVDISIHSFRKPIDSSNMQPEIWIELAEIIEQSYNKFDGFVILHGSDTMAFTASGLSFLLENLSKPVILTGSQLPIGTIRTDGKENLITAVEIAAAKENGKPLVPEVCVYFEYRLYRGNRTNKFNAEHFRAFQSPNYPLLAEAGIHIHYNRSVIAKPSARKLKVHKKLNPSVAILKLFPGITKNVVEAVLHAEGCKAIILETFGSGNASTEKWFIDALDRAIKKGMIVLNITQCAQGSVEQGRYETSSALNKIGVVGGADLTTEAALAKLMFLLAHEKNNAGVMKKLRMNMRGELTR